jgi:thymidylate synthase (FAD)
MLPRERFVFDCSVSVTAQTVMTFNQIESSIDAIDEFPAAEKDGSPLNQMIGRVMETGFGNGDDIAEFAGRQCYRSFGAGRGSADYIDNIKAEGHGSVLEHSSMVFQVAGVSRNLTHELIRHRVGTAYSQESQRYVDAGDMRFVVPPLLLEIIADLPAEELYHLDTYVAQQDDYRAFLVSKGVTSKRELKKRVNEAARYSLPSAAETRLTFTCNMRELRHILFMRGSEHADKEIQRFAYALLPFAREYAPLIFADIKFDTATASMAKFFGSAVADGLESIAGTPAA